MFTDIAECRRLRDGDDDFKDFLRTAPDMDLVDIDRPATAAQAIDLAVGA